MSDSDTCAQLAPMANNNNNEQQRPSSANSQSSLMAADQTGSRGYDYAPSPNTRESAIERATQLRVQTLLRQLLCPGQTLNKRVDTVRVLRKTLREIQYQLNWLTQMDLLETIERILADEHESNGLFESSQQNHRNQTNHHQQNKSKTNKNNNRDRDNDSEASNSSSQVDHSLPLDWRLVNDCTQLLIEVIPKLDQPIDAQTLGQLFPIVVENLGHERSEVRRSSLLLLNMYLNERPKEFKRLIRVLIEYGISNGRNERARRGAILSLPLLLSEPLVKNENLMPLIGCLCDQLIDNENEQLFYSLYLALQRLHQMLGDQRFGAYLSRCDPAASMLYKQAASRSNSLAGIGGCIQPSYQSSSSSLHQHSQQQQSQPHHSTSSSSKQVTFEHQQNNAAESSDRDNTSSIASDQVTRRKPSLHADLQTTTTITTKNDESDKDADDSVFGDSNSAINNETTPVENAESARRTSSASSSSSATSGLNTNLKNDDATNQGDNLFETTSHKGDDDNDFFNQRPQSNSSSTVSSTCSSEANLVNPAHYMTRAALSGNPLSDYETIHHIDHSQVTSLAINDIGPVCNTPTMELGPSAQNELKFGIFPRHLISASLNIHSHLRQSDRLDALQELMCIVRDSPVNHLAILMSYFDLFMEQFLSRLLPSLVAPTATGQTGEQTATAAEHSAQYPPASDARIQMIALDMIETIVIKTKVSTMHYVRPLVALLVRSLAARAPTVRQNGARVIHKIMSVLPPQHCIDALFEHKHTRNALVRAALVDRVTCAVLEYYRDEFNLTKLCYHILPMLADHNANVRLASLECIATLAHALGPERIGTLLTAAEAVQTGCDYDGLLDAINARLMRRALPRSQPDASARYVLKPFVAHAQQQQSAASQLELEPADIRWVLEAPSAHQHPHQTHHQHELEPEEHHMHLHRPGVYSPPPFDPSQRRRRSSLGLRQLMPHSSTSSASSSTSGGSSDQAEQVHAMHRQHQQQQQQHYHHHHHHHHHHHPLHSKGEPLDEPSISGGSKDQAQHPGRKASSGHINAPPTNVDQHTERPKGEESELPATHMASSDEPADADSIYAKKNTSENNCIIESSIRENKADSTSTTTKNAQPTRHLSSDAAGLASEHPPATGSGAEPMRASARNRRHRSEADVSRAALASTDELQQQRQSIKHPAKATQVRSSHQSRQPQRYHKEDTEEEAPQQKVNAPVYKRSNSQDSISSTDTSKFRQSLAENNFGNDSANVQPMLPSDSIIYTDAAQAYAYNRQQSRFQQTSFEYATDSNNNNNIVFENNNNNNNYDHRPSRSRHNSSFAVNQIGPTNDDETSELRLDQEEGSARCGSATTGSESPPVTVMEAKPAHAHANNVSSSSRIRRVPSDPPEVAHHHQPIETSGIADPEAAAAALHDQQKHHQRRKSVSSGKQHQRDNYDAPDCTVEPQLATNDNREEEPDVVASPMDLNKTTGASNKLTRQESLATSASERSRFSDELEGELESQHQSSADRKRSDERPSRSSGARASIRGEQKRDSETRRRASRSQPPHKTRSNLDEDADRNKQHITQHRPMERSMTGQHLDSINSAGEHDISGRRAMSVSPLNTNVNIRHILENVAQVEGPFVDPPLALKVALDAVESQCWSTKVEGILAFIRMITYHPTTVSNHLHEVVCRTCDETRNLRSTVARSAIFALGDYCAKLKRSIEPDMDIIVQALLHKSSENTTFIRDDIRRSLAQMVDNMTQWRLANSLINHGANHKNLHVRRMASQFIAALVERMGAAKCLVGARDISAQVIPAAAKFAQDGSPQTRYYGRSILAKLMQHGAFERLFRRSLAPNLYRSTVGIVESVRRRGPGEPPSDS